MSDQTEPAREPEGGAVPEANEQHVTTQLNDASLADTVAVMNAAGENVEQSEVDALRPIERVRAALWAEMHESLIERRYAAQLRDNFAAAAIHGLVAKFEGRFADEHANLATANAKLAYLIADAMIAARSARGGEK